MGQCRLVPGRRKVTKPLHMPSQVGGAVGDCITKQVGGKRGVEQVAVAVRARSQARSHLESVS